MILIKENFAYINYKIIKNKTLLYFVKKYYKNFA